MASTSTHPTSQEGFSIRKLLWVAPLTIVVATIVNVLVGTIAVAFFNVPNNYTNLQAPSVIVSTVVFLLLAVLAFILVGRFTRRPVQFYRILALIALILSFSTPVMAITSLPGGTMPIFWT